MLTVERPEIERSSLLACADTGLDTAVGVDVIEGRWRDWPATGSSTFMLTQVSSSTVVRARSVMH
jgi:hypothetical protein